MLDRYLITGLEIDGKFIPIANFVKEGLLEEGDFIKIPHEKIIPAQEGINISILNNSFEVVSITVNPGSMSEVIIKPL